MGIRPLLARRAANAGGRGILNVLVTRVPNKNLFKNLIEVEIIVFVCLLTLVLVKSPRFNKTILVAVECYNVYCFGTKKYLDGTISKF